MTPDEGQGRAEAELVREMIGYISDRTGDNLQDWAEYFDGWVKDLAPRITAALRAERRRGVVEGLEIAADGFKDGLTKVKHPVIVEVWTIIERKLREHAKTIAREQARRAGEE